MESGNYEPLQFLLFIIATWQTHHLTPNHRARRRKSPTKQWQTRCDHGENNKLELADKIRHHLPPVCRWMDSRNVPPVPWLVRCPISNNKGSGEPPIFCRPTRGLYRFGTDSRNWPLNLIRYHVKRRGSVPPLALAVS